MIIVIVIDTGCGIGRYYFLFRRHDGGGSGGGGGGGGGGDGGVTIRLNEVCFQLSFSCVVIVDVVLERRKSFKLLVWEAFGRDRTNADALKKRKLSLLYR
jgi:hypothetical protein